MIEHPYQLRRVELRDFKSVTRASVDMRPLTVVVGANSSGKSTLLQSILAVTQAVRTGTSSEEFPLNGEYVRLGTFEETRNFRARGDEPMQIAFELVDSLGTGVTPRTRHRDLEGEDPPLSQMTWRAYIDGVGAGETHSDAAGGFARLAALQIEVAALWPGADDATRVLSCDLGELADAGPGGGNRNGEGELVVAGVGVAAGAGRYVPAAGRLQDWETGASRAVDAVVLEGGIPQAVLNRVGQFARLAELWWNVAGDLLRDQLDDQRRSLGTRDRNDPPPESEVSGYLAAVHQARIDFAALAAERPADPLAGPALRGLATPDELLSTVWYRRLGRLDADLKAAVATSLLSLGEARFRERLREELADTPWIDQEVLVEVGGGAGEALGRSAAAALRFFRSSVRYLGPLREAPHVLYDPGPSKLDLGVRGEYAAAVLHAQAARTVVMPTPYGPGPRRSLSEALDLWLREFGVVEQVRSDDRGRIGIGLSVRPPGSERDVDLTSVGVGVSQLLPVVLLCLLAEPGTLVVLEQPELHLHPKLQQALADFLLACSRSGRQLVVETHSEHLVNRLRYLIARDETDVAHDLIELVFAEQHDGGTSYRSPGINRFGGLADDWPDGFLDINAREAQDLVRESLAKRMRADAVAGES